jgi:hypothetical protein
VYGSLAQKGLDTMYSLLLAGVKINKPFGFLPYKGSLTHAMCHRSQRVTFDELIHRMQTQKVKSVYKMLKKDKNL